ncbi:DMT family transporter [Cycloclasticus pugetii]|uniref:DMT family transporter n=1 Tax=Cycloclasticus pugetii TaxID=34068 RepID=UPI0022B5152F|nr:DMT family transporter [Cycloclasticus pugetii]
MRYMILSAFAFSIMALFVKLVGDHGIPVLEIVAARSLISLVISYLGLRREGIAVLGTRKGLLAARGLIGFAALICVFYAITHLPLAEAMVLQYLHPMFTALLALFFLKEVLRVGTLVCIFLSFFGVLIIVQPDVLFSSTTVDFDFFTVMIAIAGAFGSAVAYTLVRALGKTEHPLVIVMYFPLISLPASLILLWGDFVIPVGIEWFYLLAIGVATQVGQVGLTKSMRTESAGRATSFGYLQVVFAMLLGMLFYQEYPSLNTLLGAGLIIIGAYLNLTWKEKVKEI